MRCVLLLCCALFFGACEGNMSGYTDHFGDYHPDGGENLGIFASDSKLQGHADLNLSPAPNMIFTPGVPARFPLVREVPAEMAQGATLLDLSTRDNRPHIVTVAMGNLIEPTEYQVGPFTEVVAVLNIGIGGVPYYAEVDYVEGMQFSLAVNRLQFHAIFRTVFGGTIAPPPGLTIPPYSVGASVSSDVVAHGRQPQRTLTHAGNFANPALPVAPGGNDGVWIIPAFAKSFRVVALPGNSQLSVSLATVALGNTIAIYPVVAPAVQDYPIPATAHYIIVENTSAVSAVQAYSVIFELAL